jgi:hypothetical protein
VFALLYAPPHSPATRGVDLIDFSLNVICGRKKAHQRTKLPSRGVAVKTAFDMAGKIYFILKMNHFLRRKCFCK